MCERQVVRYVHHMHHVNYPNVLRCGCICAGRMEEDLSKAKHREDTIRGAARRRQYWPNRKGWKISPKGSLYIYFEDYRVTIFKKGNAWSGLIEQPKVDFKRFARRACPDIKSAQFAAFDALTYLKSTKVV